MELAILEPLKNWRIWKLMGDQDIALRYKRSIIGPFWITISLLAWIAGISILYSAIFGIPFQEYVVFLSCGIIAWNFISSCISEGNMALIGAETHLKSINLPSAHFLTRVVYRNFLIFLHNLVAIVLILFLFGERPNVNFFLVFPGVFCLATICYFTIAITSVLVTRFRDIQQIISNILQVMFFLTPIFWMPGQGGDGIRRFVFIDLNPFYHLIELLRTPLTGGFYGKTTVVYCLIMILFLGCLSELVLRTSKSKIFQWL